ncbi:PREDICTED: bidirectional sugar transporter SWEET5-like [Prunus mume]|uniref:Bidirectional sugar transporter SWEET n=1 Tax=Prunus mume TaxID=102107 RepID=A0ABM0PBE1_PRUMU|nr:PREDICTED: bidirectional sugar transporter SWEET5-like [Prunus mume]
MVNLEAIRIIVGIIGNVISFFLFTSPFTTFLKIIKQKSVGEFKADPYVATLLNCAMWSFYGMPFVHPDSVLVVTINGCGFVIELIYIAIFLTYSSNAKRRWILIALLVEVIFFAVVVFVTLHFLHTTKGRSMIIGILCIVFNIIMYASPLTIMKMVIKTKSVKYMPFTLSLANFCNGIVWLIYALIKFDPYILVPNGLGSISGLVQLILYATYYKSTNWDEDDEIQKSEVQLLDV